MNRMRVIVAAVLIAAPLSWGAASRGLELPNVPNSVKFAVIGDAGTGSTEQVEVAARMNERRNQFPFDNVIMLGDNIYYGHGPQDLAAKFSTPYAALLNAGVKFHAALGNHDDPANRQYPLWNMSGERYYTYAIRNVRFFVLDSDKLDPQQMTWITNSLENAHDEWKICYFHHPLYSDGQTHGSSVELRVVLEPLFVRAGVQVVFSGHDHIYERLKPQKGIVYFVSGAGGQLRKGDTRPSAMTAAYFDQDQSFMLVEISGSLLSFEAVSRAGRIVDAGTISATAEKLAAASGARIGTSIAAAAGRGGRGR